MPLLPFYVPPKNLLVSIFARSVRLQVMTIQVALIRAGFFTRAAAAINGVANTKKQPLAGCFGIIVESTGLVNSENAKSRAKCVTGVSFFGIARKIHEKSLFLHSARLTLVSYYDIIHNRNMIAVLW